MTSAFNITYKEGSIKITKKLIEVLVADHEKAFDGTPLEIGQDEYEILNLPEGYQVSFKLVGSIIEPGKTKVRFEDVVILNALGEEDTEYELKMIGGELIIHKRKLVIVSGNASKYYDGTPLTNKHYTADLGDPVLEGHILTVKVTGSQIEVGKSKNTFSYTIFDEDGFDVREYYDIETQEGTLTVKAHSESEEDGEEVAGAGLNPSGTISKYPFAGGDDSGSGKAYVFSFIPSYSGHFYFRQASFGDYNYNGFEFAPEFDAEEYGLSPLYLAGLNLAYQGYQEQTVQVTMKTEGHSYLLPYFGTDGFLGGDSWMNLPYSNQTYTVKVIPYDYSPNDNLVPSENLEFYAAYNQYVKDTYLQIPDDTKEALLRVAQENAINPNSKNIIEDVATFVSTKFPYNINFLPFPDDVDLAVYILTKAKEGLCQHYSTAATMLYRALGIPARYTVGYSAGGTINKESKVSGMQAHAWVEVYIDNFGWVPVEVTGADPNGGGGGGAMEDSDMLGKLTIKPQDVEKDYDGTPLYPNDVIESIDLEYLLEKGYTYEAIVSGSQTEIGVSNSVIEEFKLFSPDGMDVTSYFEIIKEPDKLTVTKQSISIYVYNKQKTYDGTSLVIEQDEYIPMDLPEGWSLEVELIGEQIVPGIKQVEATKYKVINDLGEDVTENYNLRILGGKLTVTKIEIEVTALSGKKNYDGLPLEINSTYVSVGELLPGHKVDAFIEGSITDAGKVKNELKKVSILDENDEDVSSYYIIKKVDGVLEIIG